MKKLAILPAFFLFSILSLACSTFLLNDNGHYCFGRNYDWITGNGMVMTNARDVKKYSATSGEKLAWTSRYGSITFNQYGKEFPTGGMNEKGLVVELMWLNETKYPKADHRPALDVLQWIQYQLDNCTTIEEVIATDSIMRIGMEDVTLHYLIADASGKAATIEFLDGKMVMHQGKSLPYPVLTNSPYSVSIQKTKDAIDKNKEASFSDNSIQRFAQACSMVNSFQPTKQNAIDYSFSILNKVSQGNYTKWSIVYDITGRRIYFITNENKNRRSVAFSDFDFNCKSGSKALDINKEGTGEVSKSFGKLEFDQNKKLVETSVQQSSSLIRIPEPAVKATVGFFGKTVCNPSKNRL